MSEPSPIAVDAMGGDRAPEAIVAGALDALECYEDVAIQLVGRPDALEPLLEGAPRERLSVVAAPDVVTMDESPARALKRKPGASVAVCAQRVAAGEAVAYVSAGNTGAVVAASLFHGGLLPGVHRPGIAVVFPTRSGTTVLCDVGANLAMRTEHYLQYAVMAAAYSEDVLGVRAPRVALLNVGTEEGKGSAEIKAVHRQLQDAAEAGLFRFTGSVEGNHLFQGKADVVVCGGFVGNAVLKTVQGVTGAVTDELKAAWAAEQADPALGKRIQARLHEATDYTTYGGAPLLGAKGCAIIAHGRSDARAIKHAIRAARDFAARGVNQHIAQRLGELTTKGVS